MTSQPQTGRPSSQRSGPVPAALTYQFRVEGHLDDHWSAWLGDLTIARHHDGTSTLTGPVADQAQLHGVLAGLRDIGATLLSLNALEPSQDQAGLTHCPREPRSCQLPARSLPRNEPAQPVRHS